MKKIQLNKKHKSWLFTSTRTLIEDRNFYREQARIKNCPISWNEYKIKRKLVTKECRKDKKLHYEKLFENCDKNNDIKTLYKITKQQLGWEGGGVPLIVLSSMV